MNSYEEKTHTQLVSTYTDPIYTRRQRGSVRAPWSVRMKAAAHSPASHQEKKKYYQYGQYVHTSLEYTTKSERPSVRTEVQSSIVFQRSFSLRPFRTAVPFWGQNYLEFEWFCPQHVTAVLKGSTAARVLLKSTILFSGGSLYLDQIIPKTPQPF